MPENEYPTQNIHLPPHLETIKVLKLISLIGSVAVLIGTAIIFLAWLGLSDILSLIIGRTFINIPIIIGFLTGTVIILFYIKLQIFQKRNNLILAAFGIIMMGIGLFIVLSNYFFVFAGELNLKAGVVFFLVGFSLVVTVLKIPHRFHYGQIMIFIGIFISLFGFFESIFYFILVGKLNVSVQSSVLGSFMLFLLCQSFILAKPDRGFIGIFTTDSLSSKLSRFSLISAAIVPPALGFLFLIFERIGFSNSYGRLALLILLSMVLSVIITWINVKLLYKTQVEHYVMKEALRINNVKLEINASDLSTKVSDLEKAKKMVEKKLNNKETLTEIVDNSN